VEVYIGDTIDYRVRNKETPVAENVVVTLRVGTMKEMRKGVDFLSLAAISEAFLVYTSGSLGRRLTKLRPTFGSCIIWKIPFHPPSFHEVPPST
jgi:hypothetical protein